MHPSIPLLAIFATLSLGYLGDITVFHPGVGSGPGAPTICGWKSTNEHSAVAISAGMMNNIAGADPHLNKLCGSGIKIYNPTTRETWKAQIIDTCTDCGYWDLALTPRLFEAVAKSKDENARVHGIAWGGAEVGG